MSDSLRDWRLNLVLAQFKSLSPDEQAKTLEDFPPDYWKDALLALPFGVRWTVLGKLTPELCAKIFSTMTVEERLEGLSPCEIDFLRMVAQGGPVPEWLLAELKESSAAAIPEPAETPVKKAASAKRSKRRRGTRGEGSKRGQPRRGGG